MAGASNTAEPEPSASAPAEPASIPWLRARRGAAWFPGAGDGIEHLASRLGAHFGAHTTTRVLDWAQFESGLHGSRRVVLLLLDGVGSRQLADHCPQGALAQAVTGELRSVFPSSTAPAVSTLATALPPHRHANPGWFAWHPDLGRVVRTLPGDLRGGPTGTFMPAQLWDWHPLSLSMQAAVSVIQPQAIFDSAFSRHAYRGAQRIPYRSLDELAAVVLHAATQQKCAAAYIYAYAPHFDSAAHEFGCRSPQAGEVLQQFDRVFERLARTLLDEDVLLLATADHGFVDVEPGRQLSLNARPDLARMLSRPLTGEPRVAFAQPLPGTEQAWATEFDAQFGQAFSVLSTERLLRDGWFGEGDADPAFLDHAGRLCLLGRDGYSLTDLLPGERPAAFIGMHGGISADEMRVPLAALRAGRILS